MKEVVSVFPSTNFQLHTTRSWDFIGLNDETKRNFTTESDVVVGVIDTGIWPESQSFNDEGFSPAPKKWKGVCEGGKNFTCNNKIIGARRYNSSSARDEVGHGSHTASTAAGNAIKGASFYGLAQGTARGGVPSARIAAYKVCEFKKCPGEAIMAAFDDAIADGVDIITISPGGTFVTSFDKDPIAIGSFHAMKKGILVVLKRVPGTDRRIIDKVVLGNGRTLIGNSVNSFTSNGTSYPLVYGKDATSHCSDFDAQSCLAGCIDSALVRGKILVCDASDGDITALQDGALGSIVISPSENVAFIVPLPATGLSIKDYEGLKSYLNSTKHAKANILKSEAIKDPAAPIVVSFSSRGPNSILPEIIKSDISAPGVNILAAFSPVAAITDSPDDGRHVKYSLLSGTSMACPHAAAAAAYIRTFHPEWSPAAIKSSLMTTAWPMNHTDNVSPAEFAHGSGHINPVTALEPGLVYETSEGDHIKLLCSFLDDARVKLISGENSSCPKGSEKGSPKDFNYPSLAAVVKPVTSFTINFNRTVKNVGLANSTYKAKILPDSKVDIKVVPQVLSFKSLNEEKTFTVTVIGKGLPDGSHASASLIWYDGTHRVRSPILVRSKAASW
ncbi:unnamed protein product [Prunus armeniaca]